LGSQIEKLGLAGVFLTFPHRKRSDYRVTKRLTKRRPRSLLETNRPDCSTIQFDADRKSASRAG